MMRNFWTSGGIIPAWARLLCFAVLLPVLGQAPRITVQPEGGLVPPGQAWALSAKVAGAQPLKFQWFRNGQLIEGETGSSLLLTNTNDRFNDNFLENYYYVARNDFGAITSSIAQLKDRVIWRKEDGGNGHGYTVVTVKSGITWKEAYKKAADIGGHLAAINNASENQFCFDLTKTWSYWGSDYGPYIGAERVSLDKAQPSYGWKWVTGEPLVYQNWLSGQLDNYGFVENYCHFQGQGGRQSSFWNDVGNSRQDYIDAGILSVGNFRHLSAIIEFPESLILYKKPINVVVSNQLHVQFEAAAASIKGINYQWQRNGVNIAGATNPVLSIDQLSPNNQSKYRVIVRDDSEEITSSEARLLFPPRIVNSNLTNQVVVEGSSLVLRTVVDGDSSFFYQWFRNTSPISDATNSTLNLIGLSIDKTAGYSVGIFNADGFIKTVPALITVLPSNYFLIYQTDFENQSMPAGWSPPRRSFTPNGPRRFLGEFGNSAPRLTLTNLPLHTHLALQFDLYLMRSVGPRGPALAFRELTTGYEKLSRFSTLGGLNYQDFPGHLGESLVSGTGGAIERHTLGYNYERIEGRDLVQRITLNVAHTGTNAVFEFAGTGWPAITTCSWGIDNVVVSSANLPEFSPPVLVNAPQSQVIHERWQTAVFSAGAAGPGILSYQWLKDGQAISGATNDYLVLPPANSDQVGLYGIRVSNENGSVVRNSARVAVVTRMPESMTATVGRPADLEAVAFGNPGFQWFHDGRSVPGSTNSLMHWETPKPEDGGDWSVRVFLDGASLDRYWGLNNTYDANYPQVAFNPLGSPGQLLWTHRQLAPVLQDLFEVGAFRAPATVLMDMIFAPPFSQGVVGLDLQGREVWKNPLGSEWNFGPATADPAQRIGFVSEVHTSRGETDVYCFDLKTGQVKWIRSISGAVVSGASIGVDGTIYLGTIRLGTERNSRLYALSREGIITWFAETQNLQNQPAIAADGTIYTTESVAQGIEKEVVRVRAFNPDGSTKWTIAPGGNVFSSPSIAADGTIYVNWPGGELIAINPDGSRKWTFKPHNGGWESTPVIDQNGNIYLGCGTSSGPTSVVSITPQGRLRWQASVGSDVWGSLAVAVDGTVYGWANRGFLFALDRDGQLIWKAPTPKLYGLANPSSPILGPDGTIYLTGASQYRSGYMQAFRGASGPGNGQWPMGHGNASNSGRAPLKWPTQNGNFSAGAPLQLRVETREPSVKFRWTKDGGEIKGETNSFFQLDRLQPDDGGEYQVELIGSFGSILGPKQPVMVDTTFERITRSPVVGDGVYTGVNWGDVDGDGLVDLFLPNPSRSPFLFRNLGGGRFEEWSPQGIINEGHWDTEKGLWADWNGDGIPELTMLDFGREGRVFGLLPGKTNFVRIPSPILQGIEGGWVSAAAADFDLDGKLDLFAAQLTWPFEQPGLNSPTNNVLLRGLGNGSFERITDLDPVLTGVGSFGASWCDYDNDGDPDLFVAHHAPAPWGGSRRNFLFRNDGTNGFSKASVGAPVTNQDASNDTPTWGDFDNDGDFDLLVTRSGGSAHQLYRNEAGARFVLQEQWSTPASGYTDASNAAWGDLDNDGWLDAIVTANKGMPALVMRNLGNGTFERKVFGSLGSDSGNSTAVTLVDDDNDGRLDVFVANYGGGNFYYRNRGAAGGWLKVRTRGVISNRQGIGAKIRVTANLNGIERQLLRQISAGDGGGNQGGWEAHFGLADAGQVSRLRIEWPSGQVQERVTVAARQILTVTESTLALPRSLVVQWGSGTTISATGEPPTNSVFEWWRDGVAIPGATGPKLTLSQITPAEAGRYQLRAVGKSETVLTAPMVLTVDGPEPLASRKIPVSYWPGVPLVVSVRLTPRSGVAAQAFEDQPPSGWTIATASDGGQWDAIRGRVKFGPYFDDQARDLSYTLVPGFAFSSVEIFAGTAAADDITTPVIGQQEIPLGPIHPADRNPFDGRIMIGEITSYASAWRRGAPWSSPPQEIPISFVTRAGYLWRFGEGYWHDLQEATAPLWWKAATDPKPAARSFRPLMLSNLSIAERRVPQDWLFPAPLIVTLQIDPVVGAGSVAVEDSVPTGWRVEEPNLGGGVDDSGQWVRWGPFFDSHPRTLQYRLVPTSNAETEGVFEGIISVDGLNTRIGGAARIPQPTSVPPRIRLRTASDSSTSMLEILGETGSDLKLEMSTDMRSWSTVQHVLGQGPDRPVIVELATDTAVPVLFWRVRR